MDFQGLLDNIKEKASSIFEKIREFYEENKMLSYIIAGLTALLLICIILIIVLAGKKKEPEVVPGSVLELTEPLAIPDGPELPKDYTASRTTKDKWSEEETEQWFTIPTQKEIDSLSKANDNLINEITGAAP
ncbi:hypothetical protein SAMN04487977_10977 [Treponema bryantii]|uniref:Uncharacterized protein n=1 Tax=Treponema bryantii TaxID=163 RepID=A0A1H9IDB9_9SPIR|nr:hypothetical protein [Treponema bryantii]SEQ72385.1 hypothetical protein SAMN04487977_10977 [Treponema bryantii]